MPSISNFYPAKWLTAGDLPDDGLVLTIGDVTLEKMSDGQEKPVVSFVEHEKGLVCNKTNAKTIAKLYGDETDDWQGQKITLYPTEVDFKGERVDAIRVKNKKPKTTSKTAKTSMTDGFSALAEGFAGAANKKKTAEPMTQAEVDEADEINVPF